MSIRTITAPGVQINEIDRSQYSPSMTGSTAYVLGFTDSGETYTPMEFTSRSAWTSFYGAPKTEAERYSYAAACETLDQGGRLRFARLPYDNPARNRMVGFKYSLHNYTISDDNGNGVPTPFYEIQQADATIKNCTAIEPASCVMMYDLSAIDEYRTGEAKVPNNTFVIADIAFNTYGKIQEDTRKDNRREMVGIMPVVTTAANAMLAQQLISVPKENVVGYETIGKICTLDAAAQLSIEYPKLSSLTSNEILEGDMCRLVNTKNHYAYIGDHEWRVLSSLEVSPEDLETNPNEVADKIRDIICSDAGEIGLKSWDGKWQVTDKPAVELTSGVVIEFSYKRGFTLEELSGSSMSSNLERIGMTEQQFANVSADIFGWHNPDGDDDVPETVSQEANGFFPTVHFDGGHFDRDNLKLIGIVVYKMFIDPAEGNKINFEPVEAFAGSLRNADKDINTGATRFIDTIVNSQSKYINVFSNCFNTPADKKYYENDLDILTVQPGAAHPKDIEFDINIVKDFPAAIDKLSKALSVKFTTESVGKIKINTQALARIVTELEDDPTINTMSDAKTVLDELKKLVKGDIVGDTVCPSMGFYQDMTKKDISISKSIYQGMNIAFEKAEDINQFDIDLVPDAGLASIASYLKAIYGDKGEYDLDVTDDAGNSLLALWKCESESPAVKVWKTVEQKLDTFCKKTRKDCMFLADGPRPLVLQGQRKIVRPTKPSNTIDACVIPNLKWISGLNTNYGACYVDWFEQADDYSGDLFWCPPSIKAMGVCINCDLNYNYWDAPAGLNRGVIAATDVAFSPTPKQAGCVYERNFNYAINYPQDGIVLEGQKTLQVKPSALDRINVRRLLLRLERASYKVAKYFIYEGNTAYTRQRLIDALDPYFRDAKVGGGLYDYKIICDETINTDTVIDNNELKVAIGVKPTRVSEFLMIDFFVLRTGGGWEEMT